MIPKVIHYIWLGGKEKPDLVKNCIASWEKNCPDYQIKEWNESNLDININEFVRKTIEAKKWAFAADYFRLWIIYNYGGIYLDSDVEILKNFDDLLDFKAFTGFECNRNHFIESAVIGSQAGLTVIEEMLNEYNNPPEILIYNDGQLNFKVIPEIMSDILQKYGFKRNNERQTANDFQIFPSDYFCCKDCDSEKILTTVNSYSIHRYTGSWHSADQKIVMRYKKRFGIFGKPLMFLTRPRTAFRLLKRKIKRRKV